MAYNDIMEELRAKYAMEYSPNYLVSIISNEIPQRIAKTARMLRIEADTPPSGKKPCIHCGKIMPIHSMFFSHNSSHKDGFSNICKNCDR